MNGFQRLIIIYTIPFCLVIGSYKRGRDLYGLCELEIGFLFNTDAPEEFVFAVFGLVFFVLLQLH